MAIRARFYVAEFNERVVSTNPDTGVVNTVADVTLNAVTRKNERDNVDWSAYSPSGKMTVCVTQKEGGAFDAFRELLGKDVSILIEAIEPGE